MSSRSSILGDSNIFNREEQDISSCSQESFDSWTVDEDSQDYNHYEIDQDNQDYNQHDHVVYNHYKDTEDQDYNQVNIQPSYHKDWTPSIIIPMLNFHKTPTFTSPYHIKTSKFFELNKEFL